MNREEIKEILKEHELKVTPQRILILDAMYSLKNHPTAEQILEYIKSISDDVPTATVYKILELYVNKGIIKRVKTDEDVMRYDSILDKHHHIYCLQCNKIQDYYDSELDSLLEKYFKKKKINNFEIKDIKLQIIGEFKNI